MDVTQPVKIVYVKVVVTSKGWSWPRWYPTWYLSSPTITKDYNVEVSSWYGNNKMWIGAQIKFYDLENYTKFCLQWM